MQPTFRDTCTLEMNHEPPVGDRCEEKTTLTSTARRWIDDAFDWLDRYWDDPELRSGFWRSGW